MFESFRTLVGDAPCFNVSKLLFFMQVEEPKLNDIVHASKIAFETVTWFINLF